MSISLDYSVKSGDGRSCSLRSFHSDHGITTFQSCAVIRTTVGQFMPSRDGIPHRHGHTRLLPALWALNQESVTGFPQCAWLMYSRNISSSMVPQHCQGYGVRPLHKQANLCPFNGCLNPISPLHAAHLDTCCSPLSERASNSQTFDRMKVKRNPPETGECHATIYGGEMDTTLQGEITALEKELIFNKYLTRVRCVEITTAFQLNETQVKICFQSRRMKQKKREREGLLPNKAPASDLVIADDAESEKSLYAPSTSSPASSAVSSGRLCPY
uniref:Homeobox A1 n=1 Tax=Oncorhynchus kisutch TaxID=8019 RepID=A0A8C7KJF2_ONCKI